MNIPAKINTVNLICIRLYSSGYRQNRQRLIFYMPDMRLGAESEDFMKNYLLFLLAMIVVTAGPANADFYTWEDESGVSHITDYPPPPDLKKQKVKVFDESKKTDPKAAASKEKKSDIVLFTKNDCPDCDKARNFLNSRSLDFTEYNLDEDKTAVEKRKAIDDNTDVPFAVINRNQVYGFTEAGYDRVLKPSAR